MSQFRSMESAPKDGTRIQAEIPGYGTDNIIAWEEGFPNADGQEVGTWCYMSELDPPICWTDGVCWEANDDEKPSVKPTKWKPI